MLNKSFTV